MPKNKSDLDIAQPKYQSQGSKYFIPDIFPLPCQSYSTKPSLSNGVEANVAAIWSDYTTFYYDTVSGKKIFYDLSNSYSSPQSVDLTASGSDTGISIYATYTESSPPTSSFTPQMILT